MAVKGRLPYDIEILAIYRAFDMQGVNEIDSIPEQRSQLSGTGRLYIYTGRLRRI